MLIKINENLWISIQIEFLKSKVIDDWGKIGHGKVNPGKKYPFPVSQKVRVKILSQVAQLYQNCMQDMP